MGAHEGDVAVRVSANASTSRGTCSLPKTSGGLILRTLS